MNFQWNRVESDIFTKVVLKKRYSKTVLQICLSWQESELTLFGSQQNGVFSLKFENLFVITINLHQQSFQLQKKLSEYKRFNTCAKNARRSVWYWKEFGQFSFSQVIVHMGALALAKNSIKVRPRIAMPSFEIKQTQNFSICSTYQTDVQNRISAYRCKWRYMKIEFEECLETLHEVQKMGSKIKTCMWS